MTPLVWYLTLVAYDPTSLAADPTSNWDWKEENVLIGSDVVSLFPSLSAENTAKAVKNQILKSSITWNNIDENWIRMYVH